MTDPSNPGIRMASLPLFGKWKAIRALGEGGNGVVYEAVTATGETAAVKTIKSGLFDAHKDPLIARLRQRRIARFTNEIQFLNSHGNRPGIVPIIDSFVPEQPSGSDRPWFAMPLGQALEDDNRGFSDLPSVISCYTRICLAVSELHKHEIYHRDIKPSNILVINGVPLLADFGLVSLPDGPNLTSSSEILGPLFYIAPEMLTHEDDVKAGPADVYSLAKSLWVSATKQRYPLPGEQRANVPQLTLSTYVKHSLATELDHLLDRATRHNPEERPTRACFTTVR